jgi:hypothetical protein
MPGKHRATGPDIGPVRRLTGIELAQTAAGMAGEEPDVRKARRGLQQQAFADEIGWFDQPSPQIAAML